MALFLLRRIKTDLQFHAHYLLMNYFGLCGRVVWSSVSLEQLLYDLTRLKIRRMVLW